jgi:two-component system, OmpR family, heavy metal sensor histidine kinase CusS
MFSADRGVRAGHWSLAARLTIWYTALSFGIVLGATAFLYWTLSVGIAYQDDQFLWNKIHVLRALLKAAPNDERTITQEVGEDVNGPQQAYVRVLAADDGSLYEAPGMASELGTALFPKPLGLADRIGAGALIHARSGKPFRAAAALAARRGDNGRPVVIEVAMDATSDEKLLVRYRQWLALVLVAGLGVSAAAGYQMARAGLRPLQRIIATTGSIGTSTLTERVVLAGLPAELYELGLTFNRMLDRLEEAFASLRQFSDDIAHELRTPIGSILGAAEVTLGQARPAPEYREALESIVEDASAMSRTVQSLLFLARSESPAMRIARETVDIAHELGLIREFYDAMASEAGVRIEVEAEPHLAAAVDRTLLQRAVSNLVANGLEHTASGGTVRILAWRDGQAVVVEVADTGCGIAAEHLPHVFDRFYRVDRTRSAAGGNVGLGLAIVKTVATLHGGAVSIDSAIGRGTRVTIRIPSSPADAALQPDC